jgi:hypothetical protein
MRVPRITFPRVWPARAVASRTLPVSLEPVTQYGVPVSPLPPAGGYSNSRAASRRVIDGEGMQPGRSYLDRTGDQLDMGPAPDRIDRGQRAMNAGIISVNGAPTGMGGWPYDGNALMIPHQAIPRRPITVSPFNRTIDTGVTIPSAPIGDPVS